MGPTKLEVLKGLAFGFLPFYMITVLQLAVSLHNMKLSLLINTWLVGNWSRRDNLTIVGIKLDLVQVDLTCFLASGASFLGREAAKRATKSR